MTTDLKKKIDYNQTTEKKFCDGCWQELEVTRFKNNGKHNGVTYYSKMCIACSKGKDMSEVRECKGIYSKKHDAIRPYFLQDYLHGETLYALSKKYGIAYSIIWAWNKNGYLPIRQPIQYVYTPIVLAPMIPVVSTPSITPTVLPKKDEISA